MPAVVAPEHDDRLVGEALAINRVEHPADLGVDVARGGVVAMDQMASEWLAERFPALGHLTIVTQFATKLRGVVGSSFRRCSQFGHRQLLWVVEIPIPLGGHKRQVRLEKAHGKKEGLARLGGRCQPSHRLRGNLPVGVGLILNIGRLRGPSSRTILGPFRFWPRARSVVFDRILRHTRPIRRHAPRGGIVTIAVGRVVDLAQRRGLVAVGLEVLPHGDGIRTGQTEVGFQIVDPERLRSQAGHQRVA